MRREELKGRCLACALIWGVDRPVETRVRAFGTVTSIGAVEETGQIWYSG